MREQQSREREIQLRENDFWLTQMISYDRSGWDLALIASPLLSQSFTPDEVRDAARTLLNAGRFVQVSLLPEREDAGTKD